MTEACAKLLRERIDVMGWLIAYIDDTSAE